MMEPVRDSARPELLHKLEGCTDEVHGAVIIPGEEGVISISNDRSVRVWLLRDSGQFWPSICHYMSTAPTSLTYCHDKRTLFVGVESGAVEEWEVARDYNRWDKITSTVWCACAVQILELQWQKQSRARALLGWVVDENLSSSPHEIFSLFSGWTLWGRITLTRAEWQTQCLLSPAPGYWPQAGTRTSTSTARRLARDWGDTCAMLGVQVWPMTRMRSTCL